jgi:hypothetical protein
VIVHVVVADTFEILTERKAFHLSKEIRVIGKRILERPMPLARLPHKDTVSVLNDLRLNDPRVIAEISDVALTAKECFYGFTIAVRAQRKRSPRDTRLHLRSLFSLQKRPRSPSWGW